MFSSLRSGGDGYQLKLGVGEIDLRDSRHASIRSTETELPRQALYAADRRQVLIAYLGGGHRQVRQVARVCVHIVGFLTDHVNPDTIIQDQSLTDIGNRVVKSHYLTDIGNRVVKSHYLTDIGNRVVKSHYLTDIGNRVVKSHYLPTARGGPRL
ncbi:hypothetical protein RRG08_009594 [Elysia crispata]|uniref:Uncharacterized protein n=1 Tax=Elysia crispata TaxID=231223 RepID=A0AAE0XT85_9GAST|nr:hypothetical protein RRG08_009594 [Elysia crispata]